MAGSGATSSVTGVVPWVLLAGSEAVPLLSVQLSVVTLTMTSSYAPEVSSVTPTVIEAGIADRRRHGAVVAYLSEAPRQ